MSLFSNKKIKGPIKPTLEDGIFCKSWSANEKDCAHDLEIIASKKFYNLVYRDGMFYGMPRPMGGPIYPFSKDLLKPGSRAEKKKHCDIEVVCLTSGSSLNVNWGVSEKLIRNKNGKNYFFNAHGTFYVEIDKADAAKNANIFYQKLCVQNDSNVMTDDALRDKLKAAFENRIAAVIEKMLLEMDGSLNSFIDVMASEALVLSKKVYYEVKDLFSEYGITIEETASVGSIVQHVGVKEI